MSFHTLLSNLVQSMVFVLAELCFFVGELVIGIFMVCPYLFHELSEPPSEGGCGVGRRQLS